MADEWVEAYDESSGHTYYQNNVTGESSWEKPAGFVSKAELQPEKAVVVEKKKPAKKKLTKEEREAQKAERLKRRAEQLEKKRLRDLEREKIRKMEEEIERKRLEEERRQRKIKEAKEALEKIQYTLLTAKQQKSLAGKGIRAVKQNSMGGIKVYLAEVELRKGGFEDEYGTHFDSINAKDYNLNTPLHVAAKLGHSKLAKKFLNLGMDPSTINASGLNALHLAIANNNLDIVCLILMKGGCKYDEPTKRLRCRSVLESGFRCPNDQVEGGFCTNRACKETGNDMLMAAMKKARENKVKFEIAEYNKQEDSDLQDKAPLIIAKLRKCPMVALFLENFANGGVEICKLLQTLSDTTTIEEVEESFNSILAYLRDSKKQCKENISKRNVYKNRETTKNISGRPFYDMISCWKSLLSAILLEPEIPNVYGHVLRYEYGVSTKWEQVSKIHKKRFRSKEWTAVIQLSSDLISSELGDIHEIYSHDRTLLQEVNYDIGPLTEEQKQVVLMQQLNSDLKAGEGGGDFINDDDELPMIDDDEAADDDFL